MLNILLKTFASATHATQSYVFLLWGQHQFSIVSLQQGEALVGAFPVITMLHVDHHFKL